MGKRLRSLASLLWDDGEPGNLLDEWSSKPSLPHVRPDSELKPAKEIHFAHTAADDCQRLPAVPTHALSVSKPWLKKRRLEDPYQWLQDLPLHVRNMERLQSEVISDLDRTNFAGGAITFDLPSSSSLASAVLQHGELAIRSLSSRHPALHKIGITRNPVARWEHSEYGYKFDPHVRWEKMTVIHAHADGHAIGLLEAALIRIFYETPGCRNVRLGGEGVDDQAEGPFFCYIVHRVLVPPTRGK